MSSLTQTITINKPVANVFAFTINPKNTPKYVASIVTEQTNEWPIKLGTIYCNQRKNGEWSEYEVVGFEVNKTLVIRQKNDDFHVGYIFTSVGDSAAKLEYSVWKDRGKLPATITMDLLKGIVEKLKEVVEAEL